MTGTDMPDGLLVRDLTVAYGGNVAVNRASFHAPLRRITGLIGPNGAGKTTTFNACSGLVHPTSGTIELFGHDVTRAGAARRARMGLGRTFQRVQVCDSMTVHENVALGAEARAVGSSFVRQLLARPAERSAITAAANDALATCGISHLADRPTGLLSTGQRRLLELARVLAGQFRLLLLDEPSSGLDEDETAGFGTILKDVVRDRGVGILLVEHDMTLVMDVCEYLHVLDFGIPIFEGTTSETRQSPVVRAAYLGDDPVGATPR